MKIIGAVLLASIFLVSCNPVDKSAEPIAMWSLADLHDATSSGSELQPFGEVEFIKLPAEEARASKERKGDGVAVKFGEIWLDAGQGINEELNITGKGFSILVRMKPKKTESYMPVITKAGNDQNIAYSIYLNTFENDIYIEAKIGSDDIGGAHKLKYKLPSDELNKWHDVVFRFNGLTSELIVDGFLRDDEITVGEIRDWNRRPFLIGAQYKSSYGYTSPNADHVESRFNGLIDHVVIWNRCISDEEVEKFSGVSAIVDAKPEYYTERYRPQFHFTAKKNWLNDPNGLVYYDGVYHLFFQYMPPHRPGAYKDWGHAVSTDLVHWEQTPNHITPHKVWAGCWSGSAIVDQNNVAGFQTGDKKTIVAFITNGGNPNAGIGPKCTQCIAYSTDGGKTFTYYDQNPIIKNIYNSNRDPKVVWDDASKKWIMSLYMDKDFDFGLFASTDLKKWEYLTTVSLEGVAECPGFEPLPVDGDKSNIKWLFFGANGNYMIGSFDGKTFKPETKVVRADYGKNFYAAQTWSNSPDGRCIHLAWMPTKRYPGMPFEQQMNFPTELTLKSTPEGLRVFRTPVEEIKNLYDKEFKWEDVTLKQGDNLFKDLKGDLFDVNLEIDLLKSTSFQLIARGATIKYDARSKTLSCGGPSVENNIVPENWKSDRNLKVNFENNLGEAPLSAQNGRITLRMLIDRTTIEVFGNEGQVVITSCFMPKDDDLSYSLKSDGEIRIVNAKVHSLKSAWLN